MAVDGAAAGSNGVEEVLRQVLQRLEQLEVQQAVGTAVPQTTSGIATPQGPPHANVPMGSTRERVPLSKLRGLQDVGVYDGKQEKYEPWKRILTSFLADEPGIERLLEWVETVREPITAERMDNYDGDDFLMPITTYDRQLHSLLTMKTSGVAATMVRNSHKSGLRAWQKLAEDGGLVTPHMRRKMLPTFYSRLVRRIFMRSSLRRSNGRLRCANIKR